MFIAFDGIDGAGKTTIYNKIAEYLSSKYYVQLFDMGKLGFLDDIIKKIKSKKLVCDAEIRECIYYFEGVLFSEKIAKKYMGNPDEHILIDRYILSFLSYGPLNGMDRCQIIKLIEGMVWPDYYFYVDIEPELALKRIILEREICRPEIGYKNNMPDNKSEISNKFISFQTNVRNNFIYSISQIPNKVYQINNNDDIELSINCVKDKLGL